MQNPMSNKRGGSKILGLLTIAAIAGAIYVGFQWGYAQWDYETMREEIILITKSAATSAARQSLNIESVKNSIIKTAEKKTDIILYKDDIKVTETPVDLTIEISWDVPLELPGYIHYFEYSLVKTISKNR